ncbi:MAG TPA: hypothetical protein VGO77_08820 [Mycobacterium sp.]|nr:hypothetical protein [Mycobacterium sp.]
MASTAADSTPVGPGGTISVGPGSTVTVDTGVTVTIGSGGIVTIVDTPTKITVVTTTIVIQNGFTFTFNARFELYLNSGTATIESGTFTVASGSVTVADSTITAGSGVTVTGAGGVVTAINTGAVTTGIFVPVVPAATPAAPVWAFLLHWRARRAWRERQESNPS